MNDIGPHKKSNDTRLVIIADKETLRFICHAILDSDPTRFDYIDSEVLKYDCMNILKNIDSKSAGKPVWMDGGLLPVGCYTFLSENQCVFAAAEYNSGFR